MIKGLLYSAIAVNGQNKKKKKPVKGKRKNRISSEEIPVNYRQPADLSATFGKSHCICTILDKIRIPLNYNYGHSVFQYKFNNLVL